MTTETMAPPPPTHPRETVTDPIARQLLGAFLTGVMLVLALRAALETTTENGYYLSLVITVVAVLGFGWLLSRAGVPDGIALTAAAAGTYAVAVIVVLSLSLTFGTPGDNAQVALFVGLVAAAITAPVATAIVQWATDSIGARGLAAITCGLGFVIAAGAGPQVNENLLDARHEAALAADLAESGLTPYLPEVEGMAVEYGGTTYAGSEAGRQAVGYSLRYTAEDDSGAVLTSYFSIEVSHADDLPCDPTSTYLTCEDHGSYTVVERNGVVDSVVANKGGVRLEATFYVRDEGNLTSPETVGEALAAAETVEWKDIVSAEND